MKNLLVTSSPMIQSTSEHLLYNYLSCNHDIRMHRTLYFLSNIHIIILQVPSTRDYKHTA